MNRGFTLIELSIVLVIIGLIIGGVLVGRDLIGAGEIRKTISRMEEYSTAANTFRNKYNCLPGDCANASRLGLGKTSGYGSNGNGNGIIESEHSFPPDTGGENFNFWYHLSASGLTSFKYDSTLFSLAIYTSETSSPIIPITGTGANGRRGIFTLLDTNDSAILANYMPSGQRLWWLHAPVVNGSPGGMSILIPQQAFAIDSKLDDGLPLSGTVTAVDSAFNVPFAPIAPVTGAGGPAANVCVSTSATPNVYNTQNTSRTALSMCSLLARAGF